MVCIVEEKLGFNITYNYEKIADFLQQYYSKYDTNIFTAHYKLCFMPRWVFCYHANLDFGYGWVNAIDSRVIIHMKFLSKMMKVAPIPLDFLLKSQDYEIIDKEIKEPILTNADEIEKLIKYKIPLMIDKKDVLITNVKLVYILFWQVELEVNKKSIYYYVNALDDSDIQRTMMPFIEQYIIPKQETTEYDLFFDTANDFSNPRAFFYNILDLLNTIWKTIITFFKMIYKKSAIGFYVLIVILLLLLYYLFNYILR